MTWRLAGAARATTGARANQEDAFAIWPSGAQAATRGGEGVLAVVADGMGGHAGGEVAGRLACETFVAAFARAEGTASDRLRTALETANAAIAAGAAADGRLRGMGCTLVGAWIDAAGLHWVSVGDSLLLLFRAPDVLRLNADHSLGAFLDEQARRNRISVAEAARNPHRNALRSALTGKAIEILDLRSDPYPLADGDWLLLASDGIATLSGDEIGDLVYANRNADPAKVAERLIAAVEAKKAPDQDNATVLVLKIDGVLGRVAESQTPAAADEAPTRVLRADAGSVATGSEETRRAAPPPLFNRSIVIGVGMVVMFLIGWLLRAWLG